MSTHAAIQKMLGDMFPDFEIPAFRYEIARRHDLTKAIPDFLSLSRKDVEVVRDRFKHEGGLPWTSVNHLTPPTAIRGAIFGTIEWNLKASDDALMRDFLRRIEGARAARGVTKPPKNQGNRNAGVNWNWIEVMDNPRNLDECNRSYLAKARKEAERLFPELIEIRKEIDRIRTSFASETDAKNKRYIFGKYRP